MEFLDKIYQKSDIFTARDKFVEFLNCELKDFATMDDYIMEHNRLYKRVENLISANWEVAHKDSFY